jgi:hypothetical protein
LWKEEEEVVVHNSQPLLFTLFWWLLHRQWQRQKEECPSFGHFLSFHYCRWWRQKENVQIDFLVLFFGHFMHMMMTWGGTWCPLSHFFVLSFVHG